MDIVERLVYLTIVISISGALSPGPLTIMTLALGSKNGWRSGVLVATGHMLVEVLYVTLLFYFFSHVKVLLEGLIGDIVTIVGSLLILYFAFLTIREGVRSLNTSVSLKVNVLFNRNPLLIGILLTGFNVWFLLWWLSIGLEIILLSTGLGILGLLIIFASHLWLDYLWLILVAETGRRGTRIMSSKKYALLLLILGAILAIFGLNIVLKRFTPYSILI